MFLLIAIVVGFAAGMVTGGRPHHLVRVPLRWNGLIFLALSIQVLISTDRLPVPLSLVPSFYVLSNLIALVWLGRNIRVQGIPCVMLGAVSNLAAIVANGGRMPVEGALLLGALPPNRVLATDHTRLVWLSDRFLVPPPFPFPTVFSIGDLLIGLGIAWLIVAGMRPARVPASEPNTSLAA